MAFLSSGSGSFTNATELNELMSDAFNKAGLDCDHCVGHPAYLAGGKEIVVTLDVEQEERLLEVRDILTKLGLAKSAFIRCAPLQVLRAAEREANKVRKQIVDAIGDEELSAFVRKNPETSLISNNHFESYAPHIAAISILDNSIQLPVIFSSYSSFEAIMRDENIRNSISIDYKIDRHGNRIDKDDGFALDIMFSLSRGEYFVGEPVKLPADFPEPKTRRP